MPGRDRTGPMGAGPMTGWGDGDCTEQDAAAYSPRRSFGRSFGRGRGFGRGAGRRGRYQAYGPWITPSWARSLNREQETSWLKSRDAELKDALVKINERLQGLEQE